MTSRNWTKNDAEALAEFAGLEERTYEDQPGADYFKNGEFKCYKRNWKPWDKRSPQWQIQSLKDAVRDEGLVNEFRDNLIDVIDASEPGLSIIDGVEAPPEAVCRAILSLEGE